MDSQLDKKNLPMYKSQYELENEYKGKTFEHPTKSNSKAIDFGPFAPIKLRREDPDHRNMGQVREMENMSYKYRPEYHNQGDF